MCADAVPLNVTVYVSSGVTNRVTSRRVPDACVAVRARPPSVRPSADPAGVMNATLAWNWLC
jgi:hypothetical protein